MDYRSNMSKLMKHMAQLKKAKDIIRKNYNDTRDKIYNLMTRRGMHKYDDNTYTVSLSKASIYTSFSTRLLKKYSPDVYKNPKYHMKRTRKGSVRIKADL